MQSTHKVKVLNVINEKGQIKYEDLKKKKTNTKWEKSLKFGLPPYLSASTALSIDRVNSSLILQNQIYIFIPQSLQFSTPLIKCVCSNGKYRMHVYMLLCPLDC